MYILHMRSFHPGALGLLLYLIFHFVLIYLKLHLISKHTHKHQFRAVIEVMNFPSCYQGYPHFAENVTSLLVLSLARAVSKLTTEIGLCVCFKRRNNPTHRYRSIEQVIVEKARSTYEVDTPIYIMSKYQEMWICSFFSISLVKVLSSGCACPCSVPFTYLRTHTRTHPNSSCTNYGTLLPSMCGSKFSFLRQQLSRKVLQAHTQHYYFMGSDFIKTKNAKHKKHDETRDCLWNNFIDFYCM